VVRLKVEDVAPNGYTIERATVRQKKTGRPVRFEITEQARQAVDEYLRLTKDSPAPSYSAAAVARSEASPQASSAEKVDISLHLMDCEYKMIDITNV
jgi:hypothetical protein